MLEPVAVRFAIRPSRFLPAVAALIAALLIGTTAIKTLRHDLEPRAQAVYVESLDAVLLGLRTDPYRGPSVVLACLMEYGRESCTDRWVSLEAVDVIGRRVASPDAPPSRGCLYMVRDRSCLCEPHEFVFDAIATAIR